MSDENSISVGVERLENGDWRAITLRQNLIDHYDLVMNSVERLVPCYRHRMEEVEEGGYEWVHFYPAIQYKHEEDATPDHLR